MFIENGLFNPTHKEIRYSWQNINEEGKKMKFMMIYIKTSNYFNKQIMLMSQYKYGKKKREMNGMEWRKMSSYPS